MIQAYNDLRSEVIKHRKDTNERQNGKKVAPTKDLTIIKSDGVKVQVKTHLVIDYISEAIKFEVNNSKLIKVKFNKLHFKSSMRLNLKFTAYRFRFSLDKHLDNKFENTIKDEIIESFEIESDEQIDDFEEATMNSDLYDQI